MIRWIRFGIIVCCFWNLQVLAGGGEQRISIEYLSPYRANISSHGINRLHFKGFHVTGIAGDSSQYEVQASNNGRNLFLSSKVPAGKTIALILSGADGKVIDLRLPVVEAKEGVILNIDAVLVSSGGDELKEEARQIIEHMVTGKTGKYFVQSRSGKDKTVINADLVLTDYVSYRYGDLKAIGFNFTDKNKNERLDKHYVARFFDNVIAVGVREDREYNGKGRVFIVFDNRGGDV